MGLYGVSPSNLALDKLLAGELVTLSSLGPKLLPQAPPEPARFESKLARC
jgi:hypothetical protein